MIWEVAGKVKIQNATVCFLAEETTAFRKKQRLMPREGEEGKS